MSILNTKNEIIIDNNTEIINVVNNATLTIENNIEEIIVEIAGVKGQKGDTGTQGPRGESAFDDFPDFTLIFDNKLI